MKLTKRVVDDTAPSDRDIWVWDSDLPGFGVRVHSSGRKMYMVQYRDADRRTRKVTIGRHGIFTTEEARAEAREILKAVAHGENPAVERRAARERRKAAPTIEDLAERYLSEWAAVRKKPQSARDDRQKLETYVLPSWRGRLVADITRKDVAALQHLLRTQPTLANRVLAVVSKAMNLAEVWGWRPDGSNPCRHVGRYREEGRERYLSERELALLGRALKESDASEYWAALLALRLLLLTGARAGEVLTLQWSHVDFERGVLRLPDSKTGAKVIMLGAPAVALLVSAPRQKGSVWVCPSERADSHLADLRTYWHRVRSRVDHLQDEAEAAGTLRKEDRVDLSDVRLHDLRHSFASVGAAGGLSLPTIGALLGHTQAATTQRYAHLASDPLRQAADIVSGHIAAVMEGTPAGEVVEINRGGSTAGG